MIMDFIRGHRKLAGLAVFGVGVLFFIIMVKTKSGPAPKPVSERIMTVRVLKVPEVSLVPRALGYGYVEPAKAWDAVAEVSGTVVELNPDLRKGSIIPKGAVLLRIDPARTDLARRRYEANVDDALAQIRKLKQTEADTRRLLTLEQNKLDLASKDLERKRKLVKQGVIAKSELDDQETEYLTQRNAVLQLKNTLNSIPDEMASLQAKLASARSSLEDAKIDESKTVIVAPFNCRVSSVEVEVGQAVKVSEVMATLDSMGVAEVLAQVPLSKFRSVMPDNLSVATNGKLDMTRVRSQIGLTAVVRVHMGNKTQDWDGKVVRMNDSVDSTTRTVGVYVAVDSPYGRMGGGSPLIKNMFAEVELFGKPVPNKLVIPRSAVHQGVVYVVDKDKRLRLRNIRTDRVFSGFVVVSEGLKAGETLVLSDVIPAIDGQLLDPVEDPATLKLLKDAAAGKGNLK